MSLSLQSGDIVRFNNVHYEVVTRAGWNTEVRAFPCWKHSVKYPATEWEELSIAELTVVFYKGL